MKLRTAVITAAMLLSLAVGVGIGGGTPPSPPIPSPKPSGSLFYAETRALGKTHCRLVIDFPVYGIAVFNNSKWPQRLGLVFYDEDRALCDRRDAILRSIGTMPPGATHETPAGVLVARKGLAYSLDANPVGRPASMRVGYCTLCLAFAWRAVDRNGGVK